MQSEIYWKLHHLQPFKPAIKHLSYNLKVFKAIHGFSKALWRQYVNKNTS